ncbi:MAG TPA: homoserine dehydrogenase [Kofleriaceae bacterium]|jgi:homoserine dehydrogenase|nr:homoserine dehydrogenase [Kofleriaceae bacterium]
MPRDKEIGVALLGLGNVGAGVVKLLEDNAAAISARLGARLAVRAIAVRAPGKKKRLVEVDPALLTTDIAKTIARPDVDIVCELIGGADEARTAVLQAIAAGKHVVTANKMLLAKHGPEVFAAAEEQGVDVYYEAAVCGGVPIIRVLREGLASDRIEHFHGIVNGTSNYILTAMTEHGRAFADVLAEAQQLGYAEADPTLDVGGGDAAHKLAVLCMLCFGAQLDADAIYKEGIDTLDPLDFAYAEKFGYVVKPLVIGRDHPKGIEARVHPAMVPAHWLLADVVGAKNAVYVTSYALGGSMYYGAGAGMMPTAMAVVSDLIEISRNHMAKVAGARPTRRHRALVPRPLLPIEDIRSRYYLRFAVADRPGVLGQLTTILGAHDVSIAHVVQEPARDPHGDAPAKVFVVTHEAREGDVRAALAKIAALPFASAEPRLIRICE